MAHSKSALKRWRQNERHRAQNKGVRSGARTAVRTAREAIAEGGDAGAAAIKEASSILDKAAKTHVIHANAAARHKSRMMRHLNQASLGAATVEAPKKARKTATKTAVKKTATKRTRKTE